VADTTCFRKRLWVLIQARDRSPWIHAARVRSTWTDPIKTKKSFRTHSRVTHVIITQLLMVSKSGNTNNRHSMHSTWKAHVALVSN